MDIADQAFEVEEIQRREALDRYRSEPERNETGICWVCWEPIPSERLALKPGALRCIDCQKEFGRGGGK